MTTMAAPPRHFKCSKMYKSGEPCRRKVSRAFRGRSYCMTHFAERIGIAETRGDKQLAVKVAEVFGDAVLVEEIVKKLFRDHKVFTTWHRLYDMYLRVCTEERRPSALEDPMRAYIDKMNSLEFGP